MEKKIDNKLVSKTNRVPGWLDDFLNVFGHKNKVASFENEIQNEDEMVAEAEVNVKDLQKIVWNDETFYVNFKENGAAVLNDYGNEVTTVPNVKSIEEVDKALNSQQIVASDVNEDTEITENTEVIEDGNAFNEELSKVVASIDDEDTVDTTMPEGIIATTEVETKEDPVLDAIIAGFGEIEGKISNFEKKLALMEQLYARQPQFESVDNQSQEDEIKHFTETSDQTSQEIAKEQEVDISTPAGRVELSNQNNEQTSPIEQMVDKEDASGNAGETEPELESEPEIDLEKHDIEDGSEDNIEEQEDCEDCEEETTDDKVEKVSGVQEKIFQQGICPVSGETLVKSKIAGDFIGIYSPAGGTEYAVNLNTGEIFRYKG